MKKVIIFDYDGVIHNTFDFHRAKIKEFTGVKLAEDEYRDMHNGNFFSHGVNRIKDTDWLGYKDFIYHDQSHLKIDGAMCEGLISLAKEFDLFIITSGGTKNISDYLKNNGIDGIFKIVLGMDTYRSKIEKFNFIFDHYGLRPDDCVFVTDTLGDILEANAVDVKTIAVDFGFHKKETLAKGNPLKIVSSAADLFEALAQT